MRSLMMPWTAKNLKERNDNTIKDFIGVAGPLKVTHMILFSQRGSRVFMRLSRLPSGPTLTFNVHSYSLQRDLRTAFPDTGSSTGDFQQSPLVVLSGFRGQEAPNDIDRNAVEVMRKMFNALFPNINVQDIKENSINRRVVLFSYEGLGQVELRQYSVHKNIAGVSKVVQQIYESHKSRKRKLDVGSVDLQNAIQQVKKVKEEPVDRDETSAPMSVSNRVQFTRVLENRSKHKKSQGQGRGVSRIPGTQTRHEHLVK
eukprot:Gregarina_sp_Poly_1__4413@NODE_237_length_10947_cov_116_066912_g209_i0_p6_GENE_NODE_237_length_10947_cov_116_066912_g209_i0NODE_237_length_10947_cov_116_066912_g209_i0_p6_ORF_typecomplete_len257_score25_52Brix/PF04427_18/6_8e33FBPase_glpX/PF03320_13/0_055Herpes_gp2/PF05955_11/0_18_NODE_237_length_10947_cov_116_066912_g209_i0994110711